MMSNDLLIVLGNQLFPLEHINKTKVSKVFMAEDFGLTTNHKHHKLKILMFLWSMRQYRDNLIKNGYTVFYHSIDEESFHHKYEDKLLKVIKDNEIISSIMFEESFKVNFESWNNAGTNYFTELGVYNIRGENYFDGMISEMCKKEDIIVASINASKLISGEIIEGGFYSESDTTPVVMLALYKIEDNKLVAFDKIIKDEEINHNYNFFDCSILNHIFLILV